MKYLLVSSFFGFILLVSLNGYFDKTLPVTNFIPKGKQIRLNPLDAILGEKKMDDGSIRKDNFQSILQLKASFLKDSSFLYKAQRLTEEIYLLTRKKCYYNNRSYSLFIKTKGDQIVSCHPIVDFPIKGAVYSQEKIYFIGDDYDEIPGPWKSSYSVKITCVDLDFKEEWSTISKPNSSYFFIGTGLKHKSDTLVAGLYIQNAGGSSMCVDYYDLFLSKKGKTMNSVFLGTDACRGRNVPELNEISTLFE